MSSAMKWLIAGVILLGSFIFSYVFLIRPWHLRWGATDAEVTMSLPGEPLSPEALSVSTRAITIHAPGTKVWPWIVQIGVGRAGWYSHDWLENLFATGMVNSDKIKPEWQTVQVGDRWLFTKLGNVAQVTLVEPGRVLKFDRNWIIYLQPIDQQNTRLIARYAVEPASGGIPPLSLAIFEPAHFLMESGMMLGIKQRAERNQ